MVFNQLKGGAILSFLNIVLTTSIGVILTPFIIDSLGQSEYGLWTMIGSFVGYISILDFGLYNSIIRFVAKYRAMNDKEGEENFLAVTYLIYTIISMVIMIIGTIMFLNIENLFDSSLTIDEIEKAKIMFIILIINLVLSIPGGGMSAIAAGYEKFIFPRFMNIIRYLTRAILIVTILNLGGRAIEIVIIDTCLNISIILINTYYVFHKLNVKIKLHQFSFQYVKEILSYSLWIFIFAMVIQFQWRIGQVILGVVAGTAVVAIYAVGVMLGTYYGAFSSAISSVFLPKATKMVVQNSSNMELTKMMVKVGRLSLIVLLYVLIAYLSFGKQFTFLWVGEEFSESYYIAISIMFVLTISMIQTFGNSILEAKNKYSFKSLLYLIITILGTILGAYLARFWGAIGMVSGTLISLFVVQNIMNIYYHKVIGLNMIFFFKNVFKRLILCGLLSLIIGELLNFFIPYSGWLNFILKGSIYSIFYILLIFNIGMQKEEKNIFIAPLQRLHSRFFQV